MEWDNGPPKRVSLAGLTRKEKHKIWRDRNKAHVKECAKRNQSKWRMENREIWLAKQREYRRKNPERDKAYQRKSKLKITYGLDIAAYDAMVIAQNGKCYVCGKPPKHKRLHVDHNHTTGVVRKLLCNNCNMAIGGAFEDVTILANMIAYLEKHR